LHGPAGVFYPSPGMERGEDARWMIDQLSKRFGPATVRSRDAVETLVLTILSQNTTDANRDRAYASLRERFPTMSEIGDALESEIALAIRAGGLQRQKAASIRGALRRIRSERGRLDLGFLRRMDVDAGLTWLLDLDGVGRKTAGIVLLFAFGKPYFPVDTHVRRVLTRVGWIRAKEEPHRRVNGILPKDPELMADLHLQLIRLGRTLCRPRDPICGECPIRDRCAHGRKEAQ
jgi:endonuclease-3